MDDTVFYLIDQSRLRSGFTSSSMKHLGEMLVAALPKVIRLLGVIGTIVMLLVGGGMYVHNIQVVHHVMAILPSLALAAELLAGLIVGSALLLATHLFKSLKTA